MSEQKTSEKGPLLIKVKVATFGPAPGLYLASLGAGHEAWREEQISAKRFASMAEVHDFLRTRGIRRTEVKVVRLRRGYVKGEGSMGESMTEDRLAEMEAVANAATPGPWEATCHRVVETVDPVSDGSYEGDRADVCEVLHYGAPGRGPDNVGTAKFIAGARAYVPELVAEVRRLNASLAENKHHVRELAGAIVAAAVRAGIVSGEQPMTGPEVLLIAKQLYPSPAEACERWRAERKDGDRWVVLVESCNERKARAAFLEAVEAYSEEARLVAPDGTVESRRGP